MDSSDLSDDGQTRNTTHQHCHNPTSTAQKSSIHAVGLLDPALSQGRRRKLDAINRLNSLGAERDIDIPQIVVIGSQSAGKSSLIESISGITLPRASGTCTRCPTECRLIHSSDPWQCTVSLRFTTDDAGQPLDRVRNVQFGTIIRDRSQVEDRLRRAQKAILNPTTNPNSFLEGDQASETNALAFSANYISLEISGPDVTDLSFIDLPGLISSVADGGRDEDVEEVKELVSSYIKRPSCIILLTVACESDFETQGAYRLAKQYDKAGTRTIGVLTKPDRIPEGEEGRWIRLIKNEISALQNGWYCVKQPSSKDLEEGLTFQEARRRGENFFSKPPWSTLEGTYKKKLGTVAITAKLNEFLLAVISKRIPEIMEELQMMRKNTKEELQKLPKRSSLDPLMELMHLIGSFTDELHRHAEGLSVERASGGTLFQPITAARTTFRRRIRATAPNFRPFSCDEPAQPDQSSVEDSASGIESPALRVPEVRLPGRDFVASEPKFLDSEEGEIHSHLGHVIYRDEVVRLVQDATTRELPGYHPFQVVQDLISSSTNDWIAPALSLIDTIHEIVVKHQKKLIEKHFAHYTEGALGHAVSNIMHEYMQERHEKSVERVTWLLELETRACTVNTHYFHDYQTKFLAFYRDGLREHIGHTKDSMSWDADQSALELMATVRAYFQVAYKRVVDTVILAIDHELVRVRKWEVQEALSSGLKMTEINGREHCQRLLAEPAAVVSLREELLNRLERLGAAQRELIGI